MSSYVLIQDKNVVLPVPCRPSTLVLPVQALPSAPMITITTSWGSNSVRVDPSSLPTRWEVPSRPVPHIAVNQPHESFYGKSYPLTDLHERKCEEGVAYAWDVPSMQRPGKPLPHFTVAFFPNGATKVPLEHFRQAPSDRPLSSPPDRPLHPPSSPLIFREGARWRFG